MMIKKNLNPFRDYSAETVLFVRRILIAFVIVFLLISILITNLYHLQVVNYHDYRTRSNENRIKLVPIAPSRGLIYDRNGVALALNRTIYQLELTPNKVKDIDETLKNLKKIVNVTDEDIANFKKERQHSKAFMPILVKSVLTEAEIARFSVNQFHFPGVAIKVYQRRYYPYSSALTHVIGYVAKINAKDKEELEKKGHLLNYAASPDIGKLGIERYYESLLHGKTGYEEVEINNRGRTIRQLNEHPPQAGKNIYLTIDLKLQIYIQKLIEGSRAAVIVTDPNSGAVLALVSSPSYDTNLFVNGISSKQYQSLLNDPDRPLINRATQGVYPPASTVKPYIAVSALSSGVINKNSTSFYTDVWQLPGSEKRFRDWKKGGHGHLNVTKAIEESADTFFYQIAYNMGIDKLCEWMKKFGFGEYTGIDLSEENAGVMPNREWKEKKYKKPWYQGDTISVGIGQGYWTATPIQMVKVLMTLINNGTVKIPHLLLGTKSSHLWLPYRQKDHIQMTDIHSNYWDLIKDGMYGVANRPNGTAYKSFIGTSYKPAVKSGTAQVYSYETYNVNKVAKHLRDHKLMTAFAPFDNPTVAVAVVLENGGVGQPIATITRHILDHIFVHNHKTTPTSAVLKDTNQDT